MKVVVNAKVENMKVGSIGVVVVEVIVEEAIVVDDGVPTVAAGVAATVDDVMLSTSSLLDSLVFLWEQDVETQKNGVIES